MTGVTKVSLQEDALDAPLQVTPAQIAVYQAQGFIRLKDVLPVDLLAVFRDEITRVVRGWSNEAFINQVTRDSGVEAAAGLRKFINRSQHPTGRQATTYELAFTQRMNLWRQSQLISQLVHAKRLSQLAANLMQVEGVRLYHDQALFKEPGGGHTPWHADQFYWPLSNDNTITLWIPLQPVSRKMGPLCFAPGSHLAIKNIASQLSISDESEAILAAQMSDYDVDESPFEPGEVSFHSGWTCHRAGPNTTGTQRAAFTIIYMDKNVRMIEPRHRNHAMDAKMWLPGIAPGMVAASPINPVL